MVKETVWFASTFPALSVLWKVIVVAPSVDTVNGPLYVCAEPPLISYTVLSTPLRLSLAVSVTFTSLI